MFNINDRLWARTFKAILSINPHLDLANTLLMLNCSASCEKLVSILRRAFDKALRSCFSNWCLLFFLFNDTNNTSFSLANDALSSLLIYPLSPIIFNLLFASTSSKTASLSSTFAAVRIKFVIKPFVVTKVWSFNPN